VTTPEGRERPVAVTPLGRETLATINLVCPGTRVVGAPPESLPDGVETDPIWGPAMPTMRAIADLGWWSGGTFEPCRNCYDG
jgi:hypothetical protein